MAIVHPPRPGDLPRAELFATAEKALKQFPQGAQVFFKYTCEACGERNEFQRPNALYKRGTCYKCAHEQEVLVGGFAVRISLPSAPRPDVGHA